MLLIIACMLTGCAAGSQVTVSHPDPLATRLTTLTEEVRRQYRAIDPIMAEHTALFDRYTQLRAQPGGAAAEAVIVAYMDEDDPEKQLALVASLSNEDKRLSLEMFRCLVDLNTWKKRAGAWDAEQDRIRAALQTLRTDLMVAEAGGISPTRKARYLGLAKTLIEEMEQVDQKYASSK